MAIGIFDSGLGGLTILRTLSDQFPTADFTYLADQAHMPYGPRTGDNIVDLTRMGCERLFNEGCDLVLLACNTASAVALRQLQEQWIPNAQLARHRPTNVLGIIVPTIESVTGAPWSSVEPEFDHTYPPREVVGIFATEATARSEVYEIEIKKRRKDLSVITEACPDLAELIENGAATTSLIQVIEKHLDALIQNAGKLPDTVILGSTHYEIAADIFLQVLPARTKIIRQPKATAAALKFYLDKHREYDAGSNGIRKFCTTGTPAAKHAMIETYWGSSITFEMTSHPLR